MFPINVANEFLRRGDMVSMIGGNLHNAKQEIVEQLDPRIPVYDASDVALYGRSLYTENVGVDVLNSHSVQIDAQFFRPSNKGNFNCAYVATLHGSHDVMDLTQPQTQVMLDSMAVQVPTWIYTADKNLTVFSNRGIKPEALFKINNAMPHDLRPSPLTREKLGIARGCCCFHFCCAG